MKTIEIKNEQDLKDWQDSNEADVNLRIAEGREEALKILNEHFEIV